MLKTLCVGTESMGNQHFFGSIFIPPVSLKVNVPEPQPEGFCRLHNRGYFITSLIERGTKNFKGLIPCFLFGENGNYPELGF